MAPRRTAEADLAAVRASSVRGVPWALMEHWGQSSLVAGDGTVGRGSGGMTYAAHEVLLDVESPGRGTVRLNGLQDLCTRRQPSSTRPLFAF